MDSLPPVPPAPAKAPAPTPKTVITPIQRVPAPGLQAATAPAAPLVQVFTAFDLPPAVVTEARAKAALVRTTLSNAVKAVDAAVKAALSLDELASDPKASQALSLEGLDPDTLKRFTKAAQPLLAYLTPPQPETPPATP